MYLNVEQELKELEAFYDELECELAFKPKEILHIALKHVAILYSLIKYHGEEIGKMDVKTQIYGPPEHGTSEYLDPSMQD